MQRREHRFALHRPVLHRTPRHRTPRSRATQAAAVLVALLTVRVVAGDLSALHRGAAAFGATRPVVVARADLGLGTRVATGDLRVAHLPAAAVPPGALRRTTDAAGRVVAVPILAGAVVAGRALAPRGRAGIGAVVAPGRRAVRVTTADGLRPDPGSVVDILATLDGRDASSIEPTVVVARAALVLAVDPDPAARDGGAATAAASAPAERVGVVVSVTALEATHIADATARGTLMLALDPPEDACAGGAVATPAITCRP